MVVGGAEEWWPKMEATGFWRRYWIRSNLLRFFRFFVALLSFASFRSWLSTASTALGTDLSPSVPTTSAFKLLLSQFQRSFFMLLTYEPKVRLIRYLWRSSRTHLMCSSCSAVRLNTVRSLQCMSSSRDTPDSHDLTARSLLPGLRQSRSMF